MMAEAQTKAVNEVAAKLRSADTSKDEREIQHEAAQMIAERQELAKYLFQSVVPIATSLDKSAIETIAGPGAETERAAAVWLAIEMAFKHGGDKSNIELSDDATQALLNAFGMRYKNSPLARALRKGSQ
jgi:hypothetical protein